MNHKHKTYFLKKEDAINTSSYYLLDATGMTLGRFASEIAKILRGKHRTDYTPHADSGDGVIVVNAGKVTVTGSKEARKTYHYYTGWIGGLREIAFRLMREKKPEYIIYHAVKGMLPKKSPLARKQLKKLYIFRDENHGMAAQKPIPIKM